MTSVHRLAFAAPVLAAAVACTPHIQIDRMQPAALPQLQPGQPVAVEVLADGTPPNGSTVMGGVASVAQGQLLNKWLAVEPLRNELTAELRRNQFRVVDPVAAKYVIRATPVRWDYAMRDVEKNLGRTGDGRLDVRIEVLPANDPGAQPVYVDTYWASASARDLGEPEAMLRAAQRLSRRFLADTQPQRVYADVDLDDSDAVTKPGIELCEQGQFEAAYQAFADIVARNPKSAPALYDLAVLAEARGQYDEAEKHLLDATRLQQKSLYYSALQRVRGAKADAAELQAQQN